MASSASSRKLTGRWPFDAVFLKSALFAVVLACFKILEAAAIAWYRHEPFRQIITDVGGGTWKGILTLALLVFAMLVHFVGYGELGRVLGEGKLERVFFQPRALKASRHGSGVALPRVDLHRHSVPVQLCRSLEINDEKRDVI